MTYPAPRTADDCTVDDVTVDGHYFRNVAKQGEKPRWRCIRCKTKRQTSSPAPVHAKAPALP